MADTSNRRPLKRYGDGLDGVLPAVRFITIHPTLLAIMGMHEAAFIHEIRWRASEDDTDRDGWVRRTPQQWGAAIPISPKQLRHAVESCIAAGWVEAMKERAAGPGDQLRSFRVNAPVLAAALDENHLPHRAIESFAPQGRSSFAPQGNSKREEPLEELSEEHAQPPVERVDPLDAFWAIYPRRVGKGAARTALRAAHKKADPQLILDALTERVLWWKSSRTAKGMIPYPATWLNRESWADEIEPVGTVRDERGRMIQPPAEWDAAQGIWLARQ